MDPRTEVKSAARAIAVLEHLAAHPDGLLLAEIADGLGCPKSSAHMLLTTLAGRGVVRTMRAGRGVVYRLGVRIFEIGQAYGGTVDLIRDGQQLVRELSARCQETVHLAALDDNEVVYLVKEEGPHAMRMVSAVGKRFPAHGTGVGKVLLAGLTDEQLAARYPDASALPALTPHTITDPERLRREVASVRRRGHAIDREESTAGLTCIAAPVYDAGGMVAAMSVSVPSVRFAAPRRQELLPYLGEIAGRLSKHLGAGEYPERITPGTTRGI
jgi:IclR family transcriptional regulator, KDG regulon repressor